MSNRLKTKELDILGFYNILKIILNYNYFSFGNKYLGVVMGCICGPTIANIFVYIYEKKWLTIHKPIAYYRFVDDLLIISKDLNSFESLKKAFGSLQLTLNFGKKLVFLDLELEINPLTLKMNFYAYFKDTNTFSYLLTSSNHPKHIFKNLIKSLFIRIRRNCSHLSDYIIFSDIISERLITRGYDRDLIFKIFTIVIR